MWSKYRPHYFITNISNYYSLIDPTFAHEQSIQQQKKFWYRKNNVAKVVPSGTFSNNINNYTIIIVVVKLKYLVICINDGIQM